MDKFDNKLGSRKYKLALTSLAIICVGVVAGTFAPGLAILLPELISGVLGVCALYYTGNVANKHVVGKQAVLLSKRDDAHGMDK